MPRLNVVGSCAAVLFLLAFYFAFYNSNTVLYRSKTSSQTTPSHTFDAEESLEPVPTSGQDQGISTSSDDTSSPVEIVTSSDAPVPQWFLGISSAARLFERRQLIRNTWQQIYTNTSTSFTARFVIGTPPPETLPDIERENATYGDIVILDKGTDNKEFATTSKPFEMLKYVRDMTGQSWNFVSKIDDDTMLNARQFWEEWIMPEPERKRAIIGKSIMYSRPHEFPSGSFYTLTGDLANLVATLYEQTTWEELLEIMNQVHHSKKAKRGMKKLQKRHEDFMMADILVLNNEEYELLPIDYDVAYDFGDKYKTVTDKTIMVHKLKNDDEFMEMGRLFGEIEEEREQMLAGEIEGEGEDVDESER